MSTFFSWLRFWRLKIESKVKGNKCVLNKTFSTVLYMFLTSGDPIMGGNATKMLTNFTPQACEVT